MPPHGGNGCNCDRSNKCRCSSSSSCVFDVRVGSGDDIVGRGQDEVSGNGGGRIIYTTKGAGEVMVIIPCGDVYDGINATMTEKETR